MNTTNTLSNTLKRWALPLAATLALLSPSAQAWDWGFGKKVTGSGVSKTETRQVAGFTGIGLAVSAKVEVRQGANEGLTITGDDNIVPLIETVVEDGKLKIRWNEKNLSTSYKDLTITVDAKTIESLSIAGSGDIHMDSLKTAKLKTSIAGSGNLLIKAMDTDSATVSISGSGNYNVSGKAANFEASIAGSGDVKASKLEANNVKISVAGSGDAAVWAKENLKVSVAGSGDVKYYGDAKVSSSVAGSGSVKRLGNAP
jgi:hypothetical protein